MLRTTCLAALSILALSGSALADAPAVSAEKAHQAYLEAINANDLERFLQTVTDDIVFIAPNGPVMEGKDQVGPWVGGYFAAVETTWQKTTLEFVVAGDWAFERYAYRVIDRPRAGGAPTRDTGNGINIYRRGEDGIWRVARDAWATDQPLPPSYDGLGPF